MGGEGDKVGDEQGRGNEDGDERASKRRPQDHGLCRLGGPGFEHVLCCDGTRGPVSRAQQGADWQGQHERSAEPATKDVKHDHADDPSHRWYERLKYEAPGDPCRF